jgi:hypothetical protein
MNIDWNIDIDFSRPKEHKKDKEKRQKLALKIKEEKKRNKLRRKLPKKRSPINIADYNQSWIILKEAHWHIKLQIYSLKVKNNLQKMRSLSRKNSELYIHPNSILGDHFIQWYNRKQYNNFTEVNAALLKNQRLRQLFKTLLTKWRTQRLRLANDNDPITLSKPVIPITIYSFELGIKYVYEAETLARDIHKKLLNNDGMFPNPVFPKNTLTNVEYTVAQLLSIWERCKKSGLTSWAFEAFRDVKFDIDKFLLHHNRILRVNAMRAVLNNPDDVDYIDTLFDFIMLHHDYHDIKPVEVTYKRFVKSYPDEPIIILWRNLCRKWYEASILIEDTHEKYNALEILYEKSIGLCNRQSELLVRMRTLNRRSR